MEKKTKTVLFAFFPFDYKAMIPYMERMAEKGWELVSFERFTAKFHKVKPYKCVCWADVATLDGGEDREKSIYDYKKSWSKRGFKYAASYDKIHYFYSTVSGPDIPQKDDGIAQSCLVNKTVWQKEWMTLFIMVSMLLVSLIVSIDINVSRLYTYTGVLSLAIFPVLILPFLAMCGYLFPWFFKMRRYLSVEYPLPTPTLSKARLRCGIFYGVQGIAVVMAVVSILADAVIKYTATIRLAGVTLAVILIVALIYRIAAKKSTVKSQILTIIFAIVLAALSLFAQLAISANLGTLETLPNDTLAITVSDLDNVSGNISSTSYKATSSPVIPKKYTYLEVLSDDTRIATECYMTISPKIAKFVFDKLVIAIGEDREITPLDDDVFGVPAYSIDSENAVLLMSGKMIVYSEVRGESIEDSGLYDVVAKKFLR